MAANVEVERNSTENNLSVLRRFTKRVQGAGILPRIRKIRYQEREQSHYKVKKRTLESLKKKSEIELLIKQGKMAPQTERFQRKK